jgi:hypothetical protein
MGPFAFGDSSSRPKTAGPGASTAPAADLRRPDRAGEFTTMFKRIVLCGLAMALSSVACAAEDAGPDGAAAAEEQVGEASAELASCNAPVNAFADWIASTRDGQHWCTGCTFVTVYVDNLTTGANVLGYYAGIDEVTQQFLPGFCLPNKACYPSKWVRTGIRGSFYDDISVDLQGNVAFDLGGTTIYVTPDSCVVGANGATTIVGTGSNGMRYSVRLNNTWFS